MSPLPRGSSAIMCSRVVSTRRPSATLPVAAIASRIVTNASAPTFPSGGDEIGADVVEVVDLLARHELVDVDGSRGLHGHCLKVLIGDFDVLALRDLVTLDDVLAVHLV